MANHYYIIPEATFFKHKNDEKSQAFLEDTGINLKEKCQSRTPSLENLLTLAKEFPLEPKEDIEGKRMNIYLIFSKGSWIGLVFDQEQKTKQEWDMIRLVHGSDHHLVIDFFQFVGKTYGNFLFYCDSGLMSLITPEKEKEVILKELYN